CGKTLANKIALPAPTLTGRTASTANSFRFFHPDYTVGPGIAPGQRPQKRPVAGLRLCAAHRRWGIAPRPETDFLCMSIPQVLQKARGYAIIARIRFPTNNMH